MSIFNRFLKDESGATAIEYSLIAALMAAALIIALGALKDDVIEGFGKIGAKIKAV